MANEHPLAIVIPAYKSQFLWTVLESIADQSCRNFQLYVGDDASQQNIRGIVREFSNRVPLRYHRFSENLGAVSLTAHWRRCIELSREPWVWLFSDDDLMEEGCAEGFYRELRATPGMHELYRFNTCSIDADGGLICENAPHPQNESGSDFLVSRLRGGRTGTAQELIFSRAAWESVGGFPDFPLGWASDDAFVAAVGSQKPIRVIAGPRLKWRLSGKNISTDNSLTNAVQKLKACSKFVEWAADFLKKNPPSAGPLTDDALAGLLEYWFFRQMHYRHRIMSLKSCLDIDDLAATLWRRPRGYGFLKTMKFNCKLARERVFNR